MIPLYILGIGEEVANAFGCTDADEGTALEYSLTPTLANPFRLETNPDAQILVDGKNYVYCRPNNCKFENFRNKIIS